MPSTSVTPANDRQAGDGPVNLAYALAQFADLQRLRGQIRVGVGFVVTHTLLRTEDYSDLLPNPPEDAFAWRGAQFRQLRNVAAADGEDSPVSGRAGHGRGAPK